MKIVKIGRVQGNDVIIQDPKVSQSHCQIIQEDNGSFTLIDTNSTNGTYVNGILRRGEVTLNPEDVIRIGDSTLPWRNYFNTTPVGPQPPVPNPPSPHKPSSFLAWAILATIFCCMPFGIVSIVHASKVDGLWNANDFEGARDADRKARTWFWWSFGIGLAGWLFYILYWIIVGVAIGLS